jgi:farnesyl diphosphate synthase
MSLELNKNMANFKQDSFKADLAQCADKIEIAFDEKLTSKALGTDAGAAPKKLIDAMRHGSLNGGKRLRPFLLSKSAAIFNVELDKSIMAGLSVEMIHCYSLIHDDLPAMDDDDLRRGKPSVHKAYDEASAILAGDNLLTLAFEILANSKIYSPQIRLNLIAELAKGAGASGMVGGQMLDLDGEGKKLSEDEIIKISTMKTGALIVASIRMGAIIGGASMSELTALSNYGQLAGRAFQLADDILDETATKEQMGKKTGKDKGRGKSTLVSLIGLEEAKIQLDELVKAAVSELIPFGEKAKGLIDIVRFFGERKH